jgi:hypothetical protein
MKKHTREPYDCSLCGGQHEHGNRDQWCDHWLTRWRLTASLEAARMNILTGNFDWALDKVAQVGDELRRMLGDDAPEAVR